MAKELLMTVRLNPKVKATVISPGTQLPYLYTAGENITAKEVVSKGETDGRIYKASAESWDKMPAFGVAIQSKSADQDIQVIQFGTVTNIARTEDFSYDDKIYVSTIAGKATKTPPGAVGDIVQSIGRAINSSDVILAIDETVVEIKEL
jgi:hypothetical protein